MSSSLSAAMRPRPPAQKRRASQKASPPPPYRLATPPASSTESLVEQSHEFPHSEPGAQGDLAHDDGSAVEHWPSEVSSILSRADDIIRGRERALSITSELSRNLYHSNVALKNKHDALLARFPSSSGDTPNATPVTSPGPAPSPYLYSSSLPRRSSAAPRGRTPSRRISVSHADLALLSDQNAELLYKLEKLETESTEADRAGKRRLGKLEKEIISLREELDDARARSEELERQSQLLERGSHEAWQKRQEWDERVKALRGKRDDDDDGGQPRDFAPGGGLINTLVAPVVSDISIQPFARSSSPEDVHVHRETPRSPSPSPSHASIASSPAPFENSLVIRLLGKVRELEQANAQIDEQQRDTAAKLRDAQVEAETIRRLYAYLEDDPDVELEIMEGAELSTSPGDLEPWQSSTVRFRSLRRTVNGDVSRLSITGAFEDGIATHMHSTVRAEQGALNGVALPHRSRRTVVGLFDVADGQAGPSNAPRAAIVTSPSGDVFDSQPHDHASRSPSVSSLDIAPISPDVASDISLRSASRLPTLGSELGSEYGDDWPPNGENHHLRTSSLYSVFDASEVSPLPSPSLAPAPFPSIGSVMQPESSLSTFLPALGDRPVDDPDTTPKKSTYSRTSRLSEVVRSRTDSWVDRRFQSNASMPLRRRRPALPVFEDSDVPSGLASRDTVIASNQVPAAASPADAPVSGATQPTLAQTRRQRLAALMLEVWLWMQFAIIILVFIWAMAKRGPRSIVTQAQRKPAA
ncbi:hypothetical protein FA95DRAFT_1552100 [Auriscalpium vulgare]|uniref:Uncharacterized protein n=1 Tax=Auriscalpium vulgare TaxID=40419 RepID=A0ACB8SBS6_9AGAM|nr:hypothetical protein FA95DRAFT_1552100 [Auriscalpium vulgare]